MLEMYRDRLALVMMFTTIDLDCMLQFSALLEHSSFYLSLYASHEACELLVVCMPRVVDK